MFAFLGQFVARRWPFVLAAWLVLIVTVRLVAPDWDVVTQDGDLAFLPPDMPSAQGERLAAEAFPAERARSEFVVVAARADRPLDIPDDLKIADQISARFHNRLGVYELRRGQQLRTRPAELEQAETALQLAVRAFDEAIRLDEQFADAWHNRGLVSELLGQEMEAAESRETAWQLAPRLKASAQQPVPIDLTDIPLVEVWDRKHELFGAKLKSVDKQALITVLRISHEFMATDNIRVLRLIEEEVQRLRDELVIPHAPGLELGISGSAAVGGDMLRAAAESIRSTEWLTLALVIVILLLVYRAPLLVVVPIITIGVSLSIATGLLALLTQLHLIPGFAWWGFKVFKTTRIFIVVLLFGSGTDFCLFLLARLREELRGVEHVPTAVGLALSRVGKALLASALTTILGLGMMFFAEFGKFRNSGPAIGLCLLVTLAACLTLAPALMCAFGRVMFWPFREVQDQAATDDSRGLRRGLARIWSRIADWLVAYPTPILATTVLLLLPLAVAGFFTADHVTFDFLSELPANRTSIQGTELLRQHFPVGEGGPVVILARRADAGFDSADRQVAARGMAGIFDLTVKLSQIPGVESVRSLAEPLGDPPRPISLISAAGRRKLLLREHRLSKQLFLAQNPPYRGNTTRFELVLRENPFSLESLKTLALVDAELAAAARLPDSFWHGSEFVYTGTTPGIRDLQAVTRSDYWRIQLFVTAAVWMVLVRILGRPGISTYLIATVLFSYFVTIGTTELYFRWHYGESFQGLDWKVPIFLFVILVAVGQDYNIYLVTRVFEEKIDSAPFEVCAKEFCAPAASSPAAASLWPAALSRW
jgi:RND superfamily putative drug exporter